ncbi:MAG: M20/M25/M40 family metallo-hydrolase [Candidatus Lokiarchaeota archaeon]|nr:M20/M25/M40 family metallo-hydrolase [Candidatus Lokiarchaeota archaeon]
MSDDTFDLLKELCEIPGPVGREKLVQEFMKQRFAKLNLDIIEDKIGNLIATMPGTEKRYAIVAHADEVGFLVSGFDCKGFIRAKWNTQSYMPDLRLVPGQKIKILTDTDSIPGYFCVKTAHVAGAKEKRKLPSYEDIFIDIGASSEEEIREKGINIGDPIVYATDIECIGKNVVGKSMDDRVGLVLLIKIAEEISRIPKSERPTIVFVSTVMEELGAKGAASVARNLDVDAVLIIDVGLADDYPGTDGMAGSSLNEGPVLVIKDNHMHYSHEFNKEIIATAEREQIPLQRAVYHNYTTDGYQIASQGQRVSALGIPCRYTHSSFETISLDDLERTIRLVRAILL